MAVQSKPICIDGHDYVITQLGAIAGRKIWLKLLQILAGPIKALAVQESFDEKALAAVISATLDHLDEATTEELYEAYGALCTVRIGERTPYLTGATFDQHFAANYLAMSKWLYECTMYNFGSFLGDTSLGAITAKFQAMAAKKNDPKTPTSSPLTSTGTSGESSPTNTPP